MQVGWIVDPMEQAVMVLLPGDRLILQQGDDELLGVDDLPLRFTVAQLFACVNQEGGKR